jgi:hypothetical protein
VTDSRPSIWYRSSSRHVVCHFPPPTVSTMVQTYYTVQLLCYMLNMYSYKTVPNPVPCSCSYSVTLRVTKSSCSWTSPSAPPNQVPALPCPLPAPPSPVLLPCFSMFDPLVQVCLLPSPVCQLLLAFSVCYPSSSLPASPGLSWAKGSGTKPGAG